MTQPASFDLTRRQALQLLLASGAATGLVGLINGGPAMADPTVPIGNLGGNGKPTGTVLDMLKVEYGTFEAWDHEFRLGCLSVGGGSGWMILSYHPHNASVHSYWAADHTHSLAGGVPLLVMDMYEHAYQMDYGANAKGYVDAVFQSINWDEVNKRAERARRQVG